MTLPVKDLHTMSRAELAALVNQALDHVETYQGVSQGDAYGRGIKFLVEDKVQLGLAKEQMEAAGRIFRQREREARRDTDALARQSLRGVNRLEVMNPLKQKAEASQTRLQGAGYSYTLSKDWLFNLEYYHLWDLDGHKASNTIWGSLTTYFKNYSD